MEAWFTHQQAGLIGAALGITYGLAGAMIGCSAGLCVRKGWKKAMYSVLGACIAFSAVLFITGMIALLSGQPYHVWYVFLLPGILGTVLPVPLLSVMRNRFREQEFRQMQARDI